MAANIPMSKSAAVTRIIMDVLRMHASLIRSSVGGSFWRPRSCGVPYAIDGVLLLLRMGFNA
jgi:hypothetical protein